MMMQRQFCGEKNHFLTKWSWNNWISTCKDKQSKGFKLYFASHTEIKWKWIVGLYVKPKIPGRKSLWHWLRQRFLLYDTKITISKRKYWWARLLINFTNFCNSKDTLKRMKKQTADWENIFGRHVSDESKEYTWLTVSKQITQLKNGLKVKLKIGKMVQ